MTLMEIYFHKEQVGTTISVKGGRHMRIASSQIDMSSSRYYSQMGIKSGRDNISNKTFMGVASSAYGNVSSNAKTSGVDTNQKESGGPNNFSYSVLGSVLQRLMSGGVFSTGSGYMQQLLTYQESESTSFSAKGTAITDDGREIDFGISISMSRQFMQHMSIQIPAMQNALFDPLVINVGTDSAKVSNQKFKFDLDSDGKEDSISMPTRGSAFLALDKNEDGKINDGNELFGTKSGDGFKDLREYDSDGNGWIDENDEVFSKLKVWYKDENGNDVLVNLKEADVGAIYLGEQDSEFTLSNGMGNVDAVIRSSGIFLHESGTVGTIQHVDLAMGDDSESLSENDENASGALMVDLNNNSSSNRALNARAKRAEREAIRARKAARKKIMEEQIEKHRTERKEIQENYREKMLEQHRQYMEANAL